VFGHRLRAVARVAVVGSYGVGLTFVMERAPERGETLVGSMFRHDHGGKGSNQAIGAARLGADTALLTAVGRDPFGDGAFELWRHEGVDASSVVRTSLPTMCAAILVEASGDNRIAIVPGALSELTPHHVDSFAPQIEAADVLLVQLEIPVETALRALEVARAAGVRTILNPAPAPPESLAATADYITPNETEAAAVAGATGTFVVTLGEQGARLENEHVPALPARTVDSTGAGDAFNAAFAVALATGCDELEAVRWGCAAGAHMVEHPGVIPGLPTRAELDRRLATAAAA
jgi:ribokinase